MKRKKKRVEFKKNTNAKLFEMDLYIKGLLRCEIFFRQNRFSIYSVFMLTSPKLIFVLPTYETDYYQILLRISLEIKEKSNVLISSFCCLFVCVSFEADVLACHATHSTEAKILRDGPKTRMRSRVVWIQINEMFCRFSTF